MIDLIKSLPIFLGSKASDKTFETELNKTILNSIPSRQIKQSYGQGVDFETIILRNM